MTPNLFPPDFGPPFRNNPLMAGPPPGPIRIERAKLLEKWTACGVATANRLDWVLDQPDEMGPVSETTDVLYLRDPLGQINWELAALQEPTGEFYLEAGLYLVVWQPEDATDGHWELLAVGSGCPYGSEEEGSEGSGSEGSGSEGSEEEGSGSEGSGSEGEGSEPEPSCIREEDVFFATLPVITNPEYILGKDENGCLGWVRFNPCAQCCSYCLDQTPQEITIRIAGVTEGTDPTNLCEPGEVEAYWNADFVLPIDLTLFSPDACHWEFYDVSPCDGTSEVHILATLANNLLTISISQVSGISSHWAIFELVVDTPVDCMTGLLGDIPWTSSDGTDPPDFSSATCEVIAVK
jgi:hypothetical protein